MLIGFGKIQRKSSVSLQGPEIEQQGWESDNDEAIVITEWSISHLYTTKKPIDGWLINRFPTLKDALVSNTTIWTSDTAWAFRNANAMWS